LNWKRILRYVWRFLSSRNFRNHVIHELERINRPILSNTDIPNIPNHSKKFSIFLCGGCELDFIASALNENNMDVYLTSMVGRSADPLIEVSDPGSHLWQMKPDHIILSNVQFFRDVVKRAYRDPISYSRVDQIADINHAVEIYRKSVEIIRSRISQPIFLSTYFIAIRSGVGIHGYLAYQESLSHMELIKTYELELYKLAKKMEGVYILDANQILAKNGFISGIEANSASGYYDHLSRAGANEIVNNFIYQMNVLSPDIARIKCCVFDLDNTLWNGILREDGPSGVAPRWNVIDALNDFESRGILLAICSKNDPHEIEHLPKLLGLAVFNKIVSKKINWLPKSHNLKEIAKELNIAIDSLAFFDDNPRERAEVALNCPNVRVFTDNDIINVLNYPEFEPIGGLTKEAFTRTNKYLEQAKRKEEESNIDLGNYEIFLKSSKFELKLERPCAGDFSRVEELIQRSNQLNATMLRTNKESLLEMYRNEDHFRFFIADLNDKFGSYGLIGIIVAEKLSTNDWQVLELAFSCRAMGRKVEHALINHLSKEAKREGANQILLNFVKTEKNQEILKILTELDFHNITNSQHDPLVLSRNINNSNLQISSWFTVINSK
jgi:FkbH-like protein